MASLEINDTNVYSGLLLILSKFPEVLIYSQLGCLFVPEALKSSFTPSEISTLESLGWIEDPVNGGWKYNATGYTSNFNASSISGNSVEPGDPEDENIIMFDSSSSEWKYKALKIGGTVNNSLVRWDGTNTTAFKGSSIILTDDGDLTLLRTLLFNTWQSLIATISDVLVDFTSYQFVTISLNNMVNVTITLKTPIGYGLFKLKLIQGDTTVTTISWASEGGLEIMAPIGGLNINSNLNGVTCIECIYDGTFGLIATSMSTLVAGS